MVHLKYDHNKWLVTSTVIIFVGFYCNVMKCIAMIHTALLSKWLYRTFNFYNIAFNFSFSPFIVCKMQNNYNLKPERTSFEFVSALSLLFAPWFVEISKRINQLMLCKVNIRCVVSLECKSKSGFRLFITLILKHHATFCVFQASRKA